MKNKGSKNFMSLSKAECLIVSKDCVANSNSKHKDAMILAGAGSYGNASSLLMLSLEEMMKGIVLSLDGNGFEFRNRVDGISSIFVNHKLRYFLAFALSVLNVFSHDIKRLLLSINTNPELFLNFNITDKAVEQRLTLWLLVRLSFIQKELAWFSNADIYRQDGFYVDYVDILKTPLQITKQEFLPFQSRIENFRNIGMDFILAFDLSNKAPELKEDIVKLQKRLIQDNLYMHLGNLVKKLNSKDFNHQQVLEGISKVSSDITEYFKQKTTSHRSYESNGM